ncbi:hypothetical protein [Methanothrix soehngenii]|uniref:hypothetical protein n=1 Tax=Methanothrix soehngenii TaxID=2223 RepID=UPI00300D7269
MNSKSCSIPQSCSELEIDLKRLDRTLQAAHRSSIDIKDAYDFYVLALKEFNKENLSDSFLYCDRANYELTSAVNEAKINIRGSRFHSLRTISYFFQLYGLYAIVFAVLAILFFSMLIYQHPQAKILDVPLWSSFFAGLGASAQILTGVAEDLRRYGLATRYKRLWYMAIPLISMVFFPLRGNAVRPCGGQKTKPNTHQPLNRQQQRHASAANGTDTDNHHDDQSIPTWPPTIAA